MSDASADAGRPSGTSRWERRARVRVPTADGQCANAIDQARIESRLPLRPLDTASKVTDHIDSPHRRNDQQRQRHITICVNGQSRLPAGMRGPLLGGRMPAAAARKDSIHASLRGADSGCVPVLPTDAPRNAAGE